ncbi:MAG TPA: MFS transporter [Ktedonobacteraceae bacterium]|nr:MFS transporter [Ktedonobacteraceae bacterium]
MIAAFGKRLPFARALKSRPYAMIWIGQTISNLGDGIFNVALAWQILLMTHSGTAMGVVLIASMIPRLVFVLIGGVAADRLPRRLIILWSDGGRGVIVLLISILGFTGLLQFWHLVIEALIFGVVDGFFNPAIMAITPDLVAKDDLASANALGSMSGNLAQHQHNRGYRCNHCPAPDRAGHAPEKARPAGLSFACLELYRYPGVWPALSARHRTSRRVPGEHVGGIWPGLLQYHLFHHPARDGPWR